jgi:hypothetical protein
VSIFSRSGDVSIAEYASRLGGRLKIDGYTELEIQRAIRSGQLPAVTTHPSGLLRHQHLYVKPEDALNYIAGVSSEDLAALLLLKQNLSAMSKAAALSRRRPKTTPTRLIPALFWHLSGRWRANYKGRSVYFTGTEFEAMRALVDLVEGDTLKKKPAKGRKAIATNATNT